MRKKELEILLQKVKYPQLPKVYLEQYTTPANLAAEILNLAFLSNDIKNKVIFDFGCGSGRLAIGASLLGAKLVVGVDRDVKMVKLAKSNVKFLESILRKKMKVFFVCSDIENFFGKCDTVIQNPPFGIKKEHADLIFLKKALECGKKVYSLHRGHEKTRNFLRKFIEKEGGKIKQIISMEFLLPWLFNFHKKPKIRYEVDLYVIEKQEVK